jgi:hypothetical protein
MECGHHTGTDKFTTPQVCRQPLVPGAAAKEAWRREQNLPQRDQSTMLPLEGGGVEIRNYCKRLQGSCRCVLKHTLSVARCRCFGCMVDMCAGWSEPRGSSASSTAAPTIPDALKPLLHECYAMYNLLTPYALQPLPYNRPTSPKRSVSGWKQMLLPVTRSDALGAMSTLFCADCLGCTISLSVFECRTHALRTESP